MFIQIGFRNCIFFDHATEFTGGYDALSLFYCRLLYSGSLPSGSRHRHLYTDGFLMPGRIQGSCRSRLHYPDLERESASERSLFHCCQARSAYRKLQNHLFGWIPENSQPGRRSTASGSGQEEMHRKIPGFHCLC